ncbi:MAG: acyl-CoA dehydrogenase, partial [Advenella sp.]
MAILAEHTILRAAGAAVRNALQVHGAMGMTWECDVHFYLKRAHFLCAMMNHRHIEADRLQQVWQLSAGRMAI